MSCHERFQSKTHLRGSCPLYGMNKKCLRCQEEYSSLWHSRKRDTPTNQGRWVPLGPRDKLGQQCEATLFLFWYDAANPKRFIVVSWEGSGTDFQATVKEFIYGWDVLSSMQITLNWCRIVRKYSRSIFDFGSTKVPQVALKPPTDHWNMTAFEQEHINNWTPSACGSSMDILGYPWIPLGSPFSHFIWFEEHGRIVPFSVACLTSVVCVWLCAYRGFEFSLVICRSNCFLFSKTQELLRNMVQNIFSPKEYTRNTEYQGDYGREALNFTMVRIIRRALAQLAWSDDQ